jgi:hypothetical protein
LIFCAFKEHPMPSKPWFRVRRVMSWTGLAAFAVVIATLSAASPAEALPSFAMQTGLACNDCHVGGFGPQLTPLGRKFKMEGYGATKSWQLQANQGIAPLAAMAIASYLNTAKDQSAPPADHFGTNNNVALEEADLFLAGRLAPGLGSFIQGAYSGVDRAWSLDQVDVRYAHELTIGGKSAVLGLSINNNPTVQDPWNTTPAWGFPYFAPGLAPSNSASPLIAGGLEHQVAGFTPYLWLDNHFYVQAGGYVSLSGDVLKFLNDDIGPRIDGVAPYWRLAYNREWSGQALEFGVFGMEASLQPDRQAGPTDHMADIGLDASYQYLGNGSGVFSVNASYIHENQTLDATFAAGGSSNHHNDLDSFGVDLSYYWRKHYGLTVGAFDTWGSKDTTLYAPGQDSGSRTGRPTTAGYRIQLDWTPFGDAKSFAQPWVNMRLGLQYTGYVRFNGADHNYDGFGRNAGDNNAFTVFIWTAF